MAENGSDDEITWTDVAKEADELAEEWERHADICAETEYGRIIANRSAAHWKRVARNIRGALRHDRKYRELENQRPKA